jgi:hypothetical protein
MGKGSGRRPTLISDEEFARNMERWQTPKPKKERYVPPPLLPDPAVKEQSEQNK